MQIDDVRRVLIIGSGTMGQQIGLQCATHGYDVVLYDIDPTALESGMARICAATRTSRSGRASSTTRRASGRWPPSRPPPTRRPRRPRSIS